jgi:hypothetical protein
MESAVMGQFTLFSTRREAGRISPVMAMRHRVITSTRIALFCAAAVVTTVSPAMADSAPRGWLDVADCQQIYGWALDDDTPSTSIDIHVYDGPAGGGGVLIGGYTTDYYRGDVNAAYNVDGNHGFNFPIPSHFLDGGTHYVYVYGINSNGVGPNPPLEGVGVPVTCPPPSSSPSCTLTASPSAFVSGNSTILSWTASNSDSFYIDQGLGYVSPVAGGSVQHWPPVLGSLTYTGTATGPAGSANCYATVTISPSAPASYTFLIHGSFNESGLPDFVLPGSDESNAIAATYGYTPQPWPWSNSNSVFPPLYLGIVNGGHDLAQFINGLPPGDVNLISHSHGGNVVLMSQAFGIRPVRRYIQLATPVNWDFNLWRWAMAYGQVAYRCQVSAENDWIQFGGASPFQIFQFGWELYQAGTAAWEAYEALADGDYVLAYWWFTQIAINLIQADYWFDTAKIEVEGPTLVFSNVGEKPHAATHEPPIWNAMQVIHPPCV